MHNKILDKLTVVVFTYNRQAYALRALRYWIDQGIIVHVLDGSKDPIPQDDLENLLTSKSYYYHLPISWNQRIAYATTLVTTPYVVVACEDEFYVRSGLISCLNELELDPELVACGGRRIGFDYFLKKVYFWQEGYARDTSTVKQDTPFDRMAAYRIFNLTVPFYAVTKTEIWKKSFRSFIKKEFPIYCAGEIQYVISLLYLGKFKLVSEATWLRSYENKSISFIAAKSKEKIDISLNTEYTINKWWNNMQNIESHQELLKLISTDLSDNPDEQEKIKAHIVRIFEFICLGYTQKKSLTLKIIFKHIVLFLFNENIEKFIKGFLSKWFGYSSRLSLNKVAKNFIKQGIKVDVEEVKKIESLIISFHARKKSY